MSTSRSIIVEAFNRTAAHPEDWRVRLTTDSDDLVAIHHEDVKAVIWQRDMPEAFRTYLNDIEPEALMAQKNMALPTVSSHDTGLAVESYTDIATDEGTPQFIHDEVVTIARAFQKAMSHPFPYIYDNYAGYGSGWTHGMRCAGIAEDRVRQGVKKVKTHTHVDGQPIRTGVVYANDPELGVGWYPGDDAVDHIDTLAAAESFDVSARGDSSYTRERQVVDPGHMVIFKGYDGIMPITTCFTPETMFVHDGPILQPGQKRMAYFFPK